MTITDDDLERLLAEAAALAPKPVVGPPRLDADEAIDLHLPARRMVRWLPAAAAVVVALAIGSVVLDDTAGDGGDAATKPDTVGEQIPMAPDVDQQFRTDAGGTAGGTAASTGTSGGAAGSAPLPAAPSATGSLAHPTRIVYEGSVEVEVGDGAFTTTVDRVTALATGLGGHVSATQTTEQGDAPRGTVTVRVPAAAFEQLLGEVRRLGEVQAVATSGTDVTAQYTDLEARLRALGATRDQFLTILTQAEAIPDILAVQDRLNVVQVEIESLEGQRRVLEDRSAFGTLSVTVAEPGANDSAQLPAADEDDDGGLRGAWDEATRGFGDAIEWLVARSGKALVAAAVGLALYAIGRVALRRWRRTAL